MKKRLAKKAFSAGYYNVWVKPGMDKTILVPRNGRCWNIIQRACYYMGHPEYIEKITKNILKAIGQS